VFAHACRLGAEGIVSKKVDGKYRSGPCRVWIKVRNPASLAVQRGRGARCGIGDSWTCSAEVRLNRICPESRIPDGQSVKITIIVQCR
jgi:hypothetical protein